jgi:ubiquinone/menaquinone biosynthesis C-methylase UbiE
MSKMKPQVDPSIYYSNYDSKSRWINYWCQIEEVLKSDACEVLEIGIGNSLVSDYLKRTGKKVTTLDIEKRLNPDYVGDVRKLSEIFGENQFDIILCSEVLEHIPFEDFEKTLKEIERTTSNKVVIGLPFGGITFFTITIPKLKKGIIFSIEKFWEKHVFDGQHFREIGKRGFSTRKITNIMKKYFTIENRYIAPEDPRHMIFVLKKQKE